MEQYILITLVLSKGAFTCEVDFFEEDLHQEGQNSLLVLPIQLGTAAPVLLLSLLGLQ